MAGRNGYGRYVVIESCNRVEISLPALRHNYLLLKKKAPAAAVLAIIKADGYGHGMIECAKTLAAAGADCFGVAEAVEGIQLRKSGIQQPILLMGGILPEVISALFNYRLTPVASDGTWLNALSDEAVRRDQTISLHLKVDAGMGRQGCSLADTLGIIANINSLPGLTLGGILAHFPKADKAESHSTSAVASAFCLEMDKIHALLPKNPVLHLANSGGILYFPDTHQDMIRPGIALYGCYPDGTVGRKRVVRNNMPKERLRPVMRFSSQVIQIREVPPGTGLGYGHIFTTDQSTRIAIIPTGYDNGYLRSLSNKAQALIQGRRVPAVGRISMNLTMFDVTDIGEVVPGDEVVLLGCQGDEEITADEIAEWMGTINYEVLCLFGNLNKRVYAA